MEPNSEPYTTFRIRYGQYKYKVLPFGLCGGPSTFQRYINSQLVDYLDKFCFAYINDIIIYLKTQQEHMEHVKQVLQRLRKAGLQADIRKCEFNTTRTKFLGFIIFDKGIEIDSTKVQIVANWTEPTSKKGI